MHYGKYPKFYEHVILKYSIYYGTYEVRVADSSKT